MRGRRGKHDRKGRSKEREEEQGEEQGEGEGEGRGKGRSRGGAREEKVSGGRRGVEGKKTIRSKR